MNNSSITIKYKFLIPRDVASGGEVYKIIKDEKSICEDFKNIINSLIFEIINDHEEDFINKLCLTPKFSFEKKEIRVAYVNMDNQVKILNVILPTVVLDFPIELSEELKVKLLFQIDLRSKSLIIPNIGKIYEDDTLIPGESFIINEWSKGFEERICTDDNYIGTFGICVELLSFE